MESQRRQSILMMDANEDVIDGEMCNKFGKGNLNMREVVYSKTNVRGPTTYFKIKLYIDGIWVAEEL
jgi:hypothetical protein